MLTQQQPLLKSLLWSVLHTHTIASISLSFHDSNEGSIIGAFVHKVTNCIINGDVVPRREIIRLCMPLVKSFIQQRKTTCLLSIRKSLACARASKLTTTNMCACIHTCMHMRTDL